MVFMLVMASPQYKAQAKRNALELRMFVHRPVGAGAPDRSRLGASTHRLHVRSCKVITS
jgi:hypothetical protein